MIEKLNSKVTRIGESLQTPFLLAIRLYWGWQFFMTGKGKLANIPRVTGFFESLHIPFPEINAYFVGAVEAVCGLALFVGLASRLATIPLIATLVVAYLTAHLDSVRTIFADPDNFVTQAPFLFLLACLTIFIFGPGKISLDNFLFKIRAK